MSPSQKPRRDKNFTPKTPPRAGLARLRPTTARQPRFGIAGSLMLHAGIVAGSLFVWQHALDLPKESAPVPVDLITIAPKTNVAPVAPQIKITDPKSDFTPAEITPPPPVAEPVEPAPEKPVKVKPAPEPPKKNLQEDFSALLNKLTKPPPPPKNARKGATRIAGIGDQNAMAANLADALRSQIYKCWSPPVGAPNADELVVDFDLFLNQDGTVAQPPQLSSDSARAAQSNPFTRAAAEAARRAIYQCAPYHLPADQYSQWREVDPLHFDPRQMMGQ